jgi:hypothetical protein
MVSIDSWSRVRRVCAGTLTVGVCAAGPVMFTGPEGQVRGSVLAHGALTIELSKPVYRGSIFPTERLDSLEFSIATPQWPQQPRLEIALRDAAGLVRGQRIAEGAAARAPQRLPVQALPAGTYRLSVRLLDAQQTEVGQGEVAITKLAPQPGSEVRIDSRQNILVNGRPMTFVGWYGRAVLDRTQPGIQALQNFQTPVTLPGLTQQDMAPLRTAHQAEGVYSVLSVEPRRLGETCQLSATERASVASEWTRVGRLTDVAEACIRRIVRTVRSEPWLFGYYLADEPEDQGARPDWLVAAYRLLKEIDPYHPVVITNDTPAGISTHGVVASDIVSPDPYSPDPEVVAEYLAASRAALTPGKALMVTLWAAAAHTHFMDDWVRGEAYAFRTLRQQRLLALTAGARGWTEYTSEFFLAEPRLRYALPAIWRELRFLAPAMAHPLVESRRNDQAVAKWLGRSGGHLYAVAVNTTRTRQPVQLEHPALRMIRSFHVVGEGRRLRLARGVLHDTLGVGEARIYTTDPRSRTLPTLAAVKRLVERRLKESQQPGNLLAAARGVRAFASAGYATPWYLQGYLNAVNGVRDDAGWTVLPGRQSSWLDLILPREAEVHRIVVYSPNLSDYEIELTDAAGVRRVSAVRGNRDSVATHRFSPAVRALHVRLTVRSARPGGRGAAGVVVREVEAYGVAGPDVPTAPEPNQPAVVGEGQGGRTALPGAGAAVQWFDGFVTDDWNVGGGRGWSFDSTEIGVEPRSGGGVLLRSTSRRGYASMSRALRLDSTSRYLQAEIPFIEPQGYDWVHLSVSGSDSSRQDGPTVLTRWPGIYTLDLRGSQITSPTDRRLTVTVSGAVVGVLGHLRPGPQALVRSMRVIGTPVNGLVVTRADGSPLAANAAVGDSIRLRVLLDSAAQGVNAEALSGSRYDRLTVNGGPYVQLKRSGMFNGREWEATVVIGTDWVATRSSGQYPVLFRAFVSGGAIVSTSSTVALRVQ